MSACAKLPQQQSSAPPPPSVSGLFPARTAQSAGTVSATEFTLYLLTLSGSSVHTNTYSHPTSQSVLILLVH
jgi:hypothetical protein